MLSLANLREQFLSQIRSDVNFNTNTADADRAFNASEFKSVRAEGKAGTASAMAADNVAYPSVDGTYVAGGIGNYGGESAQAMGVSHKSGATAFRAVMTRDSFASGYSMGFQIRLK